MATRSAVQYVDAKQSRRIDERLMTSPGFTIDQLMELAGYSVAEASMDFITQVEERSDSPGKSILVLCGPGNNGGDGLVAARHLKHFGYEPSIVYPKRGKGVLFENLVQQMIDLRIPVFEAMQNPLDFNYAIDALFGFSFTGVPREPYASMIRTLSDSKIPVISVDIPSGWDVDHGDIHNTRFQPHAVVSLTAPKLCMRGYTGVHYVGGRCVLLHIISSILD
jgi:NAD(P)H-hydrate epimerase